MGAVQFFGQVAQGSERQHPVVLHGARGVDHHDVHLRLYIAVLEPVVHDDEVDVGVLGADAADPFGTLLAHGHHRIGEFEFDLQRLVAHIPVMGVGLHLQIPLGTAAVPARQQGDAMHLRHIGDHHLGHRGFARTADGDVADTDDRDVELLAFEDTPVEETVTESHPRLIEESRRSKQAFQHFGSVYPYNFSKVAINLRNTKQKKQISGLTDKGIIKLEIPAFFSYLCLRL